MHLQVAEAIAQKVSKKKPASSKGIRPVDKSQASKGKLDYVKVHVLLALTQHRRRS